MKKEVLTRPFPPELIRQRDGPDGKPISYIETRAVIARLNEGCDAWSFEIVEHHIHEHEVVVVGKLLADGIVKMAFGGSAITVNRRGEIVSIADDLKAAASDALKKCASLLGVALELYGGKKAQPQGSRQQSSRPQGMAQPSPRAAPQNAPRPRSLPAADRITTKQLGAIRGACRRKNIQDMQLEHILQQRTGKAQLEELTKTEASNLLGELLELNGSGRAGMA